MRAFLIAATVCALAGCGRGATFKDYRDEEARLLTVRTAVQDLRRASTGPGNFKPRDLGGEVIPPEFEMMLDSTISSAEAFCSQHSRNDQYDKVRQILEAAREIKEMNAEGPSEELTAKIEPIYELSQTLEMRAMTEEEKATVERSIK